MYWKGKEEHRRANYFPHGKRKHSRISKLKIAKGLPGSYIIAEPRKFPEEQKKKKPTELIGTISVGTQRNSWTQILRLEKIWRESAKDWGVTGKSFHQNAVLESIFPIWFPNQKMPENDATDRKCFQSTPFPPWALGAAKGLFIVATNQGTRSYWYVWSLQRFWSQSYANHTHRGPIHLWDSY